MFNMGSHPFISYSLSFFGIIVARYLFVAGLTWWLFYPRTTKLDRDALQDVRLSMVSAGIFALAIAAALELHLLDHSRICYRLCAQHAWYIAGSYLVVLVLQDAFFYATHRLFHHPKLYRWTHQGHHRSKHPSPWTSFAFDPIESAAHVLFLIGIVLIIPLHLITILAVLTTMSIWAVVNHLGLERLPVRFPHHWLGCWIIGPAHHSIHHNHQNLHYGLYFTFWDRVFGTEDRDYASAIKHESKAIPTYSSTIESGCPITLDSRGSPSSLHAANKGVHPH
jgi:sterol desaturase/sphingolipid hydroxylase (fatty acid hydroxylase superfamily)